MRDMAFMRKDQRERPRLNVPADFVPYKSKPAWATPDPLDEGENAPLNDFPVEALESRPEGSDAELLEALTAAKRAGAILRVATLRSELRRRKRECGEPCDCLNRPAGAPCRYPDGCY